MGPRILLFCFLVVSMLSACSGQSQDDEQVASSLSLDDRGCILPLSTFDYPTRRDENAPVPGATAHVPLRQGWEEKWELPSEVLEQSNNFYIELIQIGDASTAIWISNLENLNIPTNPANQVFLVYEINSGEWYSVPARVTGLDQTVVELFAGSDGAVFGRSVKNNLDASSSLSIVKYDAETRAFSPISVLDEFRPSLLEFDGENTFWGVQDNSLVRFNLDKFVLEVVGTLDGAQTLDLVLSDVGDVFVLQIAEWEWPASTENLSLFKFHETTGLFREIRLRLNAWPPFSTLQADYADRIWFGAVGWMGPDEDFHNLFPAPIFLTNIQPEATMALWRSPRNLLLSSDGRLWFASENGLAWLKPESEEWCWFTTINADVYEDGDHHLWLIDEMSLYSYDLEEN